MSESGEANQTGTQSHAESAAATASREATSAVTSSASVSSLDASSDAPSSEEDHEHLREQVIAQQRARRREKQKQEWEATKCGFRELEAADNWRQLKHAVNFGRWGCKWGLYIYISIFFPPSTFWPSCYSVCGEVKPTSSRLPLFDSFLTFFLPHWHTATSRWGSYQVWYVSPWLDSLLSLEQTLHTHHRRTAVHTVLGRRQLGSAHHTRVPPCRR